MLIKNVEALEKMNEVKELQENGKKVAVAGDGINDARPVHQFQFGPGYRQYSSVEAYKNLIETPYNCSSISSRFSSINTA